MTGLEYESVVANYLRCHGYNRVSVTKGSGDFGIDVIAHKGGHKYAVQCKYYTSAVSLDAVQEAVAGMAYYNCDRAMVVTNSTYTNAAKELAKYNNVILVEGVSSTRVHVNFKPIKWLIIAAYVFIVSAASAAAFDVIKTKPFWFGLFDAVTFLLTVTAPLWLWLLYKVIKKKIATKAEHVYKSVTNSVVPTKYADAEKIYSFLSDNDYFVSIEEVEKVVALEVVTTARVQRTLKLGYARAAKLIDLLLENEYITMTDNFIYKWSYRAK